MEKVKQYVFSARTTEEGLKRLSELKAKLGVGWDELVVDGMCGHYNLDKASMSLPKKAVPAMEQEKAQEPVKPEKDAQPETKVETVKLESAKGTKKAPKKKQQKVEQEN